MQRSQQKDAQRVAMPFAVLALLYWGLLGPVANITGYEWVLKHVKPLVAFLGMHLLPF